MSARTKAWRKAIEGDPIDDLIEAAWEAVETVESLEGKYVVRKEDVKAAKLLLNTPGDTLGSCRDLLRTMVAHAERVGE